MNERGIPLRTQILLTLLGGAILPLGLVGFWLTSSAIRSGEALLRNHLDASVDRLGVSVEARWKFRESDIALIAGNDATLRAVVNTITATDSAYLRDLALGVAQTIPVITLRDAGGRIAWTSVGLDRATERAGRGDSVVPAPAPRPSPVVRIDTPIIDGDGRRVGLATTDVAVVGLLPGDSARAAVPGTQIAVRNDRNRAILLPFSAGVAFPDSATFTVGTATWLGALRELAAPRLSIAVAAPLAPYVDPFARTAHVGVIALLVVAGVSLTLIAALITRAMHPLRELVIASDAVTKGQFDQQVRTGGPAEVRHVGHAFNVMTGTLRNTLDTLSRRSALAAVGEFATSLSHDVRNALTAVRLDLERAELRDIADPVANDLVSRSLSNVSHLESLVTGALRVARRGHSEQLDIDLRDSVRDAATTVRGAFATLSATLDIRLPDERIGVRGDGTALQQMFTNLFFNAAQALRANGVMRVTMDLSPRRVVVVIADNGIGMSTHDMAMLDTPFFSSKHNGTGLGLPIARQIVSAHGGELTLKSSVSGGTTVRVDLPRGNETFTVENTPILHAPSHAPD